jgi:hypothetical protein
MSPATALVVSSLTPELAGTARAGHPYNPNHSPCHWCDLPPGGYPYNPNHSPCHWCDLPPVGYPYNPNQSPCQWCDLPPGGYPYNSNQSPCHQYVYGAVASDHKAKARTTSIDKIQRVKETAVLLCISSERWKTLTLLRILLPPRYAPRRLTA